MAVVPIPNIFYVLDSVGDKPNATSTGTYDGQVITNGYTAPAGVNVTGYESGVNAGTYAAVYTPDDDHEWSDGTQDAVTVTLTINALDISAASITLGSGKTYNGQAQTQDVTAVKINGMSATFTVSGNVQTNAGNYTLTCTGTGNFTGTATASWTLAKAAGWCNLSAYSFEFDQGNANTFTINASGALSVASQSGCTVSISGPSGTVTSGTIGSGSFTLYSAESQNYLAAYSSVASVNVLNPYFYFRVRHYLDRDTCWGDFYAHNGVTFFSHFGGSGSINCSSHSSVAWIRKINLYPATASSSRPVRVERYYNPDITSAWRDLSIYGDSSRVVWSDHIINRYLDYTYVS